MCGVNFVCDRCGRRSVCRKDEWNDHSLCGACGDAEPDEEECAQCGESFPPRQLLFLPVMKVKVCPHCFEDLPEGTSYDERDQT